jgi:transcriptional/translational regulatory protein YebC/TACO1
MFHKKGYIVVPQDQAKEDDLLNLVLEAGGDDLQSDADNFEIFTALEAFDGVLDAIKKAGITPSHAQVEMVPQNRLRVEGTTARQLLRLLESLDDHDDVQNVFSNMDVDEKQLEEVAG